MEDFAKKWKTDMAELRRHFKAWVILNKPVLEESNRRTWAFGVGVARGEDGREQALQGDAAGNLDTKGEEAAFALGVAAGPVLRKYLWGLVLSALRGKSVAPWLREVLVAMLTSIIPSK